ncbi:hypothetical protein CR207_12205 [Chromobacterium violaceum]|uniref:DUF2249 domain-containing protein n=1 Tax=Chromobacterium violaceum TaxID=536 RepID=UPI000C124E95|nr:DUF2249 domain-containing protein [Chromobacterium violaceum]ATP29096.1 hypothetical protein CRN81_12185 [Chromobacterium violaceum]ATP33005.1 hypothetical protein CR207_12205 [Chromobacterium violaceum]
MPLDLRALPPPEPMDIVLHQAEQLAAGQSVRFVLPHFPTPLLPLLDRMAGLAYRFELSGDGGVLLILERT